ncbi:hypothetical protein [Gardnerella vaginalis]|uniref:hypothetical protein n=1 Tax=Gardnerella TaxID=2701 RepID=UPI001C2DD51E|nr:hypothetical protein [Gardnerella vaginalis]
MIENTYPVALSRLGDEDDTREKQAERAITWLCKQSGGSITVITPNKRLDNKAIERFVQNVNVNYYTWRENDGQYLTGRILYAFPNRERLSNLWNSQLDALAVLEWCEDKDWMTIAKPIILLPNKIVEPTSTDDFELGKLPNGISDILSYLAGRADGYSQGMKWNEVDQLKSDLMECPKRWEAVTPEEVRQECLHLNMKLADVDKITELVTRRKQGRTFNLSKSSYKGFKFKPNM